jgi:hypothetical protein
MLLGAPLYVTHRTASLQSWPQRPGLLAPTWSQVPRGFVRPAFYAICPDMQGEGVLVIEKKWHNSQGVLVWLGPLSSDSHSLAR